MELTPVWTLLSVWEIMEVCAWLIPFALIMGTNIWIDKKTFWPREYHRKYSHILSGLTLICSTWYLNLEQLIVFAVLLMLADIATRTMGIGSAHKVERKTIGTFLFPLSFLILVVLFASERMELVRYGMWILTIPDALAAVVGSQWGKQIPRFNKSLVGSTVFAGSVFMLTLLFSHSIIVALGLTIVLTGLEFIAQWGSDNLLLPVTGALLMYLVI